MLRCRSSLLLRWTKSLGWSEFFELSPCTSRRLQAVSKSYTVFQKPLWSMWRRQKKKQMLTIITGACVKTTALLGIYNRFWKDVHFSWCPQYFGSIVNFVVRLQSKKSTTLPGFLPCGKLQKQRWSYILCFLKQTFLKHVRATEDMLLRMIASVTTQKTLEKTYRKYTVHMMKDFIQGMWVPENLRAAPTHHICPWKSPWMLSLSLLSPITSLRK